MAGGFRPVTATRAAVGATPSVGMWLACGFIGFLVFAAFAGLGAAAWRDGAMLSAVGADDRAYVAAIAGFTLWQASWSTLLSVLPGMMLARALHRQQSFSGRAFVLRLMALPLALPPLIAALGLLALFGRNGIAAPVLAGVSGGEWPGIYGLSGILLAHVFFNMPLAARFFLTALDTIPPDAHRLAEQLGLGARARFMLLERPVLAAALPGTLMTVFLLCATSFTLVLMLGGGPQTATIEVAIYQALRFDYAPGRAALLALAQAALALAFAIAASRFAPSAITGRYYGARVPMARPHLLETVFNATLIALAAGLVALPLLAAALKGVAAGWDAGFIKLAGDAAIWRATMASLLLGALAALLALALASALLSSGSIHFARAAANGGGALLAVSPIVIGAGWFVLVAGVLPPFALAPFLLVAVNAVMALPFVLRMLAPAWLASRERHDRLATALGLSGLKRFRIIEGRALVRPLAAAAAFAACLSLGDLGVIALFGSDGLQTLPGLLHARMGSYRSQDAAALGLLLMALCFALLWLSDRISPTTSEDPR
jgi:thiamine transport system permease protein